MTGTADTAKPDRRVEDDGSNNFVPADHLWVTMPSNPEPAIGTGVNTAAAKTGPAQLEAKPETPQQMHLETQQQMQLEKQLQMQPEKQLQMQLDTQLQARLDKQLQAQLEAQLQTQPPTQSVHQALAHTSSPAQAEQQDAPHPAFSLRRKIRSVFALSAALFFVMNACFTFLNPFRFDPYNFAYKGWAWWMMNDLRHDPDEHNVALLGSSIMLSATAGCDANYLNKGLDLTKYHKAQYLDKLFETSYGGKFNTFNMSAPGQNPSDAYLYLRAMIETANRPDVVVYGLAPRDFIDATLKAPNDTESFEYLTRLVNVSTVSNVSDALFRSPWEKLDWFTQQLVYLYGCSLDVRLVAKQASERLVDAYIPRPTGGQRFTWWDRVRMLPNYIPGEMHPEAMVCSPLTREKIAFSDNSVEYRARYKDPDSQTFHTQLYFLRKIAEYCQRERIELVLVNMPVTRWNASLLPPGMYNKYLNTMEQFSWNHNVIFYDLCDFSRYSNSDFHDTVHLNAFGGKKFFDTLSYDLQQNYRASTMLSMAGSQLEKRTALAMGRHAVPKLY